MKKSLFLLFILLIINKLAFTQTVTLATTTANPSKGTVVYNNGTNQLQYWNGTAWIPITNAASGTGWALNGNNINNTNVGNVGIATLTPNAIFNVANGKTVLFGADTTENAGSKLIWYPSRNAFRAGFGGIYWQNFADPDYNNINYVGNFSFASGNNTYARGTATTAMGNLSSALGDYSTAIGNGSIATADNSTALGKTNSASGVNSTALGNHTSASGENSTSMGINSKAIGFASTAMGDSTTASGYASIAMGDSSIAIGNYSTALGYKTTASGSFSTAMGYITTASGSISTAMGFFNTASGYSSTAVGNGTTALGDYSTAMGLNTSASGKSSTAMGSYTTASGWYATAMGAATNANGNYSTAMGENTTASGDYSTAMGIYNVAVPDALLMVGNGTFNNRSNAMTVMSNGRVGIGTTDPIAPLHVAGNNTLGSGTNEAYWFGAAYNTGSSINSITNGTWSVGLLVDYDILGKRSIVSAQAATTSDARIKNIIGLSSSQQDLAKVRQIQITDYRYKDVATWGNQTFKKVIAQQVEAVYPQAVRKMTSTIPDIYSLAEKVTYNEINKTLTCTLSKEYDIKVGEKIEFVHEKQGKIQAEVVAVSGNSFTVKNWQYSTDKIFVYGREVNDFRTVDYEAISMLGISAIQELAKENEVLKSKVNQLESNFTARINALEAMILK